MFFFLSVEIITCVFILKQLFASGSVIISKYSPRLRLGEYSPIITSPSANNCLIFGNLSGLKAVVFLWRFGTFLCDAKAICGTRSPLVTSLSSLYERK